METQQHLNAEDATLGHTWGQPAPVAARLDPGEPVSETSRADGLSAAIKRAFDLTLALIGLILLAPVMLVIAIAIKLDSPGPVIYRQPRVGRRGVFEMLKFRTMEDGADEMRETLRHLNENDGVLFKSTRDPRVTRIGRMLRPAFLDEIPQLFQVLIGQMSIVGPRAMPPQMNAKIDQPYRGQRLAVRPGITGSWQIDGTERRRSIQEMARMDVEYVRSWSLAEDLRILLKTAPYVLARRGI